jgi:gamma-glutamyltranspeptidase/glutathione hydrolase
VSPRPGGLAAPRTVKRDPDGIVAAGHPSCAAAGAEALRAGGNAVDGAIAAMLAAFTCEPLLTGLGAGGYMLVAGPEVPPVLLDFFVESPGRGASQPGQGAELQPVSVSFGDAVQVFNIGVASIGTWGVPAGVTEASRRYGRMPLAELVAPAARLAREGAPLNAQQAYVVEILAALVTSTPEAAAIFAPGGRLLREGDRIRQPDLGDALERLGTDGAEAFYTGELGRRAADWISERGGPLALEDLAAYRVIERDPLRVSFRGREVLLNPPPSAGGILLAMMLALLDAEPAPATNAQVVSVMQRAQAARTPEFLERLSEPGFAQRFLEAGAGGPWAPVPGPSAQIERPGRLGSTTHVAVLDREGLACSVTTSNGASSGVVIPGTGLHANNMLGEQDLNPLGFHRHPPGRRLPSMMAPTVLRRPGGPPELALGSAGSNRIRSAILQTILRVIDDGLPVDAAVAAPRLHFEDGVLYTEPGIEVPGLGAHRHAPFRELNLFFGGVQAVQREPDGTLRGGGDPRRGGASLTA